MLPFEALILICSLGTSPAACQPAKAVDVILGGKFETEMQCNGFRPQATVAANGAALAPRPGLEYMKIICRHVTARTFVRDMQKREALDLK